MAKAKNSSFGRSFLFAVVLLALLAGALLWNMQQEKSRGLGTNKLNNLSTEGLSAADTQEIEAIQKQLQLEKARTELAREKLRARGLTQQVETAVVKTSSEAKLNNASNAAENLEIEQQRLRIQEMIAAQLKGAEENKRLVATLEQKNQEIEVIRKQNIELANKLQTLDSNASNLFDTLVQQGESDISTSDQDYIQALSGNLDNYLTDDKRALISQAEKDGVDVINSVQISDASNPSSPETALLSRVDDLMEEKANTNKANLNNNVVVTEPATSSGASGLQDRIDSLFSNRGEIAANRQLQSDLEYLESLSPVEAERSNETRWVTVRAGDTLWIIAQRAYNDGWLYPKIYAANPQILNNPDIIQIGQRLRVPL